MKINAMIKNNVEGVKDRVRSYRAERDVNKQFKARTKALKNKLEYEDSKEYLSTKREMNKQNNIISLAHNERKKETFSYKLGQQVRSLQSTTRKRPKRAIANVGRGAFFSSGNVGTGSHDRNVLFGNVNNSILYGNNKRRK